MSESVQLKRFLTDNPIEYNKAIQAAKSFLSKKGSLASWDYVKPFDARSSNPEYFKLMYDLLNILQVMSIPSQGRILEVGSGPGWITEILLMLGFQVDALEPSEDFIQIAQNRAKSLAIHYQNDVISNLCFHQTTLEEVEFDDESFNGILFYDVLHHVVHEEIALEKAFRFLMPGGCLGVVDPAWHPNFTDLERAMRQVTEEYGTVENPFSVEYLDHLLNELGFVDITRYVGVNGFFHADEILQPLENFASIPFERSNNLTARKPYGNYPNCYDLNYKTDVKWTLISSEIDPKSCQVSLKVHLENTGQTLWNNNRKKRGYITVALRQGLPGEANFREAHPRHLLPQVSVPGDTITLDLTFNLPLDASQENWELDLICEQFFWFSNQGISSCSISLT